MDDDDSEGHPLISYFSPLQAFNSLYEGHLCIHLTFCDHCKANITDLVPPFIPGSYSLELNKTIPDLNKVTQLVEMITESYPPENWDTIYIYESCEVLLMKSNNEFTKSLSNSLKRAIKNNRYCYSSLKEMRIIQGGAKEIVKYFPFLSGRGWDGKISINVNYPSKILDHLYLGGVISSRDRQGFIDLDIRSVIDISTSPCKYHSDTNPSMGIEYLLLENIIDDESQDMKDAISKGLEFIEYNLSQNKSVLVHCNQGKSRSATIVIAYLMKHLGLKFEVALSYVKSNRSIVQPNRGFCKQLIEFE